MSLRTPVDRFLPRLPEPTFAPRTVGLALIDLQYADAHPEFGVAKRARQAGEFESLRGYYDRVEAILPNVVALLAGSRRANVDVFHVRLASVDPDAPEVNRGLRLRGSIPHLKSAEAEFLPQVAPLPDECVLNKTTMSAFNSTPLRELLRERRLETLVVAGVVTNGCVEMTARDAADHGFSVVLASDACTAGTEELHHDALKRMTTSAVGLIWALSVEDILDRCSRPVT